jgi:hypothetical protein
MGRFRITIARLLWIIAHCGVGFAALRSPFWFWASAFFSLLVASLAAATLTAVYRLGSRRAFWTGFALCGWLYQSGGSVKLGRLSAFDFREASADWLTALSAARRANWCGRLEAIHRRGDHDAREREEVDPRRQVFRLCARGPQGMAGDNHPSPPDAYLRHCQLYRDVSHPERSG